MPDADTGVITVSWIDVLSLRPALAPEGIVYSTSPEIGVATTGGRYYIKGPDSTLVAAETLGYTLAELVGLPVPRWALMKTKAGICFASRSCSVNSGVTLLLQEPEVSNPEFWSQCVAFDMWIANPDRNSGNVVAETVGRGRIKLHAIDFEKARVLRGQSRFTLETLTLSHFLPTGELSSMRPALADVRRACQGMVAVGTPAAIAEVVTSVQQVTEAQMDGAALASHLVNRLDRLEKLCMEAYK